jgi:hypothetical protein
MKAKIFSFSLALLVCTSALSQPVTSEPQSRLQQAKNAVANQFKHLKNCLGGKEPCSKADLAVFGSSVLFLYAILAGIRGGLVSSLQQPLFRFDPFHRTAHVVRKGTLTIKQKIKGPKKRVFDRGISYQYI